MFEGKVACALYVLSFRGKCCFHESSFSLTFNVKQTCKGSRDINRKDDGSSEAPPLYLRSHPQIKESSVDL